jgi:hypothetical protein
MAARTSRVLAHADEQEQSVEPLMCSGKHLLVIIPFCLIGCDDKPAREVPRSGQAYAKEGLSEGVTAACVAATAWWRSIVTAVPTLSHGASHMCPLVGTHGPVRPIGIVSGEAPPTVA